jgi:hypothetical protein
LISALRDSGKKAYAPFMTATKIVAQIDAEIFRLHHARNLLTSAANGAHSGKPAVSHPVKKKRTRSRKRIAAAQKKRWAAQRKAAE